MTTIKTYPQDRLAAQPIGYWSREAATLVIGALRASLAEEHLTQPHWWTLGHVAGAPGTWTRTALTEKLTPFDDQNTDFTTVYDDLSARGWLKESEDGTLTLTPAGEEARLRAHARNAEVHTRYRRGIDDTTYAATIDTLRRMVANLGGDGDLP
ncbi:MarR family winged helix-turn-helix transcriptional regulator [Streptomyces sp. NPDC058304]|uniref:MarR family winged helix-turn-helix transcriptional regulator n=1 Tax=Streptomyces sp. NPDC058304 TaxID=3346437 RepID=UPI0036F06F8F